MRRTFCLWNTAFRSASARSSSLALYRPLGIKTSPFRNVMKKSVCMDILTLFNCFFDPGIHQCFPVLKRSQSAFVRMSNGLLQSGFELVECEVLRIDAPDH